MIQVKHQFGAALILWTIKYYLTAEKRVGLSGTVLTWFRSYLKGRGYIVVTGDHKSERISMMCVVPQGSIHGPLLFNLHMLPVGQIIHENTIITKPHHSLLFFQETIIP